MGVDSSNSQHDAEATSLAIPERIEAEVREIIERHSTTLSAFARMTTGSAELGEEALQEAYHRYVQTRSQGTTIENPLAWMLRVIQNLSIDWRKSDARKAEIRTEVAAPPETDEDPQQALREILETKRGLLSPREREVLDLRLRGLRYIEIAGVLKIGEGSVSKLLSRAFRKLRR